MDEFVKQIEDEVDNIGKKTPTGFETDESKEQMSLLPSSGALIAEQLEIPAIQMEIDRAVWQVRRGIKASQGKDESGTVDATKEKPEQQR